MTRLQFLNFTTNENGFVDCHNFVKGWESNLNPPKLDENPLEKIGKLFFGASCKGCRYMKFDECFFDSAEIHEVRDEITPFSLNPFSKWYRYRCDICGQSLSQAFTILKKRYIKRKEGIDIPVICSSCYKHIIKYGNVNQKFINSTLLYVLTLSLPVLMVTFVTLLFFLLPLYKHPNAISYAIFIIFIDLLMVFVVYNYPVKRLRLLAKGKQVLKDCLSNPAIREFMLR